MELSEVIIREMRDGEQKQIRKIARRAFQVVEGLFVGTPKKAMAAEWEGRLIGGILYQDLSAGKKKTAYIDEAFVAPEYQGLGVGKKLYTETFAHLWEQGYEVLTALVKDDNVGSWKLFLDNRFQRVSLGEIIREIGVAGLIKHYLKTPLGIAVGMDFYMSGRSNQVTGKGNGTLEFLAFFLANTILLFPIWIRLLCKDSGGFLWNFPAYLTILLLFVLSRYAGMKIAGSQGKFRFNNGGSLLLPLLSLFGNPFLMNANWYPQEYEDTESFRRKLAIPEVVKWLVFIGLPFLKLVQSPYAQAVGQWAAVYLVFMLIPLYPFEGFGGGRIYRYHKKLWFAMCVITIAELFA